MTLKAASSVHNLRTLRSLAEHRLGTTDGLKCIGGGREGGGLPERASGRPLVRPRPSLRPSARCSGGGVVEYCGRARAGRGFAGGVRASKRACVRFVCGTSSLPPFVRPLVVTASNQFEKSSFLPESAADGR